MPLDVRLPIGLLFLLTGAVLLSTGLLTDPQVLEAKTPGLNIDLVWGAAMALFGLVMLGLYALGRRKNGPGPD